MREAAAREAIRVGRIGSLENAADIATKCLPIAHRNDLLNMVVLRSTDGLREVGGMGDFRLNKGFVTT